MNDKPVKPETPSEIPPPQTNAAPRKTTWDQLPAEGAPYQIVGVTYRGKPLDLSLTKELSREDENPASGDPPASDSEERIVGFDKIFADMSEVDKMLAGVRGMTVDEAVDHLWAQSIYIDELHDSWRNLHEAALANQALLLSLAGVVIVCCFGFGYSALMADHVHWFKLIASILIASFAVFAYVEGVRIRRNVKTPRRDDVDPSEAAPQSETVGTSAASTTEISEQGSPLPLTLEEAVAQGGVMTEVILPNGTVLRPRLKDVAKGE